MRKGVTVTNRSEPLLLLFSRLSRSTRSVGRYTLASSVDVWVALPESTPGDGHVKGRRPNGAGAVQNVLTSHVLCLRSLLGRCFVPFSVALFHPLPHTNPTANAQKARQSMLLLVLGVGVGVGVGAGAGAGVGAHVVLLLARSWPGYFPDTHRQGQTPVLFQDCLWGIRF
ncbi:uncharacterized protein LY79DRAFT_408553 [Colletotrichum navitas]|uniref:Uncharacterized protein n=1 Tax=Colletotrichum navitas TaxID=681940 RepID=A0AAD8Q7E2_9PEZI|nr:uncharacterized protein LY79DRAFT_408553 [Colletotrichum navitas]KAK1597225.1 hypothetical protein LY79DRAFT_408553 [Colletotrichum navitas]